MSHPSPPRISQKTFRTCLPHRATLLFLKKDLHHEFGDMKKFSPEDDFVSRPRIDPRESMSMNRKKPDLVNRFSGLSGVLQHAAEFQISSVETKHGLEVPVSVNQDEKELLLTKNLENPYLGYETEFPKELEVEGMRKEMKSMVNFDVFTEVAVTQLNQDQLSSAISCKWVKTRKPDGSVRCRLVCRGFD